MRTSECKLSTYNRGQQGNGYAAAEELDEGGWEGGGGGCWSVSPDPYCTWKIEQQQQVARHYSNAQFE